jgi:hypothetical protein
MSTAQPLVLSIWLDNLYSRLPFFAALIGFAAWCGFHERSSINTRVTLSALAASVFWTLLLLAKTGSASNYWMEPCVAALIVFRKVPRRVCHPSLQPLQPSVLVGGNCDSP